MLVYALGQRLSITYFSPVDGNSFFFLFNDSKQGNEECQMMESNLDFGTYGFRNVSIPHYIVLQ